MGESWTSDELCRYIQDYWHNVRSAQAAVGGKKNTADAPPAGEKPGKKQKQKKKTKKQKEEEMNAAKEQGLNGPAYCFRCGDTAHLSKACTKKDLKCAEHRD